jgi:hypothetical protein
MDALAKPVHIEPAQTEGKSTKKRNKKKTYKKGLKKMLGTEELTTKG